jgi:hypothetical protein
MNMDTVMLTIVKHPSLVIENKQKQILRFLESDGLHRGPEIGPLPPRRSKLWSAVRMRDRDDIVERFLINLLG